MVGIRPRMRPVGERVDVPALGATGVADEQEAEASGTGQVPAHSGVSTVVHTDRVHAPLLDTWAPGGDENPATSTNAPRTGATRDAFGGSGARYTAASARLGMP